MLKKWFGSLLVYHICTSKGLVTVRTDVAKVMFLHVFVCVFTGGSASVHAGMPSPGVGTPPPAADTPPREQAPPPQQMATVANGTYPTGMHSC